MRKSTNHVSLTNTIIRKKKNKIFFKPKKKGLYKGEPLRELSLQFPLHLLHGQLLEEATRRRLQRRLLDAQGLLGVNGRRPPWFRVFPIEPFGKLRGEESPGSCFKKDLVVKKMGPSRREFCGGFSVEEDL